jgi:hypothetical protein
MTDDIAALILEIQARIDAEGCGPEWAAGMTLDHRIIKSLERLTVPSHLSEGPLPEEIAGLINRLRHPGFTIGVTGTYVLYEPATVKDMFESAAALERMARENERLNVILGNHGVTQLEKTEIMLKQADRIIELEDRLNDFTDPKMPGMVSVGLFNTERETCDRIRSDNDSLRARIRELEAERDAERDRAELWKTANGPLHAIKAKTIEECIAAGNEIAKEWREDAEGRVAKQPPRYDEANTANAHANGAEEVVDAIRALNQPEHLSKDEGSE